MSFYYQARIAIPIPLHIDNVTYLYLAMAKCEAKETKKAAGSTKYEKETKKAADSAESPLWPAVIAITKAKEEAEKAVEALRPTIALEARSKRPRDKDEETRTFTRTELFAHISEEMHGMLWHGTKRPWSRCVYEADFITERIFDNTRPRLRM